ncbi:hypothetical protein [Chitinimonas lacunae]|uniref:Secreted protein n=1 Tax=Chitinimonas lacunae TaxID=1963018 RepID=A0ABV8MUC9_9NEIS
MKTIYTVTLAAGLVALGGQAHAEEALAQSFDEALVRAVMQDQDSANHAYRSETLQTPLNAAVTRAVETCTSKAKKDRHRRLRFAAALGPDGSVAKVWSDSDPVTADCLSQQLLKVQLPKPPKSPYYLQMDMSLDTAKSAPKAAK